MRSYPTLRALALALALAAPLLAGTARAETGASPFGASAYGRWTPESRTPLAAPSQGQTLLEMSGATGGGGQHQ